MRIDFPPLFFKFISPFIAKVNSFCSTETPHRNWGWRETPWTGAQQKYIRNICKEHLFIFVYKDTMLLMSHRWDVAVAAAGVLLWTGECAHGFQRIPSNSRCFEVNVVMNILSPFLCRYLFLAQFSQALELLLQSTMIILFVGVLCHMWHNVTLIHQVRQIWKMYVHCGLYSEVWFRKIVLNSQDCKLVHCFILPFSYRRTLRHFSSIFLCSSNTFCFYIFFYLSSISCVFSFQYRCCESGSLKKYIKKCDNNWGQMI